MPNCQGLGAAFDNVWQSRYGRHCPGSRRRRHCHRLAGAVECRLRNNNRMGDVRVGSGLVGCPEKGSEERQQQRSRLEFQKYLPDGRRQGEPSRAVAGARTEGREVIKETRGSRRRICGWMPCYGPRSFRHPIIESKGIVQAEANAGSRPSEQWGSGSRAQGRAKVPM